jgi:nicotinate-nucleotide adenylyltransferase
VSAYGLFGGSFDPVHAGHLHAAREARAAFGLERVLFAPAARPPHKPGVRLADGAHRVAMLELALSAEPAFEVWAGELDREGPSWTVDTVRELARENGEPPHLILGDDNLAGLPAWRDVEELLALARPIVVRRELEDDSVLETVAASLSPAAAERLRAGVLACPALEASATELRALLERGESAGDLLPPGVEAYAREHGLYAAER